VQEDDAGGRLSTWPRRGWRRSRPSPSVEGQEVGGQGARNTACQVRLRAGTKWGADVAQEQIHPPAMDDATYEEEVGSHGEKVGQQRPHQG
jgi:hypothetical protein